MFENILKMSLYGGVAAISVMLLRLIPKIPPRIKFILWCLVFIRLIVPPGLFTIPSPMSMQTIMPEQAIEAVISSPSVPNTQATIDAPKAAPAPDTAAEPVNISIDLMDTLEKVWLIGVSACAALMISTYLRVFKREKFETAIKGVYASDHFVSPAVVGLLRPRVVLPMSINPNEAQDIILHERTHIRRGDHITKLIFAFVVALHWFNPVVWLSYHLAVRDMEMAVDEAVLIESVDDIRKQYAATLLNVAQEHMLSFPGFGESDIKRRVKGILSFKKPSRLIAVLSVAVIIAAGAFFLTGNALTSAQETVKIDETPKPAPSAQEALTERIGEDNPLTDFTFALPPNCSFSLGYTHAEFSLDGMYAGSISRMSYYPDEVGYSQLMGNHTEQIGGFEETSIDFIDEGAWREHLYRVVKGRFISDDRDDPRSGKTYEHVTYYLIFDEKQTYTNSLNDALTYYDCYALDFVTKHIDGESSVDILEESDIADLAASFALRGELPYKPFISFDEMESMAVSALTEAFDYGTVAEAYQMRHTATGGTITDDPFATSTRTIVAQDGRRVWKYTIERNGIRAVYSVDMDTGKAAPIKWSRISYETIPSLIREGYTETTLTFIDETYDPDSATLNKGEGIQPILSPREAAQIALRALYDMTGYQVDSCFAQTIRYDFSRADLKFSHVDDDKMYDYFCQLAVDTQTGRIIIIDINLYEHPKRHIFNAEDFIKPENFDSMNDGEIAQYYYENSSYGDRRPISRFERSMIMSDTINLYLETGEFYEVDIDPINRLPYRFRGSYPAGFTH